MSADNPAEPQMFMNRTELRALGIRQSNMTLIRWEKAGRFPKRAHLGGTSLAWVRSEVMAWCEERIAERSKHVYAES
jgi:prophage regulatory protein